MLKFYFRDNKGARPFSETKTRTLSRLSSFRRGLHVSTAVELRMSRVSTCRIAHSVRVIVHCAKFNSAAHAGETGASIIYSLRLTFHFEKSMDM